MTPQTTATDPTTGEQIPVNPDPTAGTGAGSKLNVLGQAMIPTDGGLGIVGNPNSILPSSLSQYATGPTAVRESSTGELIPAYQAGTDFVTPSGWESYNLPGEETPAETVSNPTVSGLSKAQQDALQNVLGFGLSTLLSNKATGSGVLGTSATGSGITTGESAGTSGGAPGGTELDPSTGKAPQLVWGDKYSSLKEGLNL
jgi:hypothetical protein